MEIKKFKLSTSSGEKIKLNDVDFIGFGVPDGAHPKFEGGRKELFISCEKGRLQFDLDKVNDIEFVLKRKDFDVCVHSHINKEDE